MINTENVLKLLENQERRNENQQQIIKDLNKTIKTYEEHQRLLKELLRNVVEENNIFRQQMGLEEIDFSDILGS